MKSKITCNSVADAVKMMSELQSYGMPFDAVDEWGVWVITLK